VLEHARRELDEDLDLDGDVILELEIAKLQVWEAQQGAGPGLRWDLKGLVQTCEESAVVTQQVNVGGNQVDHEQVVLGPGCRRGGGRR